MASRALARRFEDLLLSVYLYNEYRGYTQLEKLLAVLEARFPGDEVFLAAVRKHAADERKHYLMFREYFRRSGRMPFAVGAGCGYVDRMVRHVFGCSLEELDTTRVGTSEEVLFQLCRLVMITEERGLRQVEQLLRWPSIRRNPSLQRIFAVVHDDEPSHSLPYRDWLAERGIAAPGWRERLADWRTHWSLVCWRLPVLFLHPRLARRTAFPA